MKYLVIMIVALLWACKNDNPDITNSVNTETKYTIEELESDTNWVEITDIDTVGYWCYNENLYYDKTFLIKNGTDLNYFLNNINDLNKCDNLFINDFDFNKKIIFASNFISNYNKFKRRIFVNDKTKEFIYNLEFYKSSGGVEITTSYIWTDLISINHKYDYSYKMQIINVKL